ncbi:MAG TPA: (4Fe-4S)-binding protein [Flavisolibacter sp.]|nr:(4Fe-4S)-binding protein [Flavisolibacter sp.]
MDPNNLTKTYTNGEVTIVWKPASCIHSTLCWKEATGLPSVFDPRVRPWIRPEGASTEKIIEQVNKCPSGALTFYYNGQEPARQVSTDTKVEVVANGPLLVYGNISVRDQRGVESKKFKVTAFCRCGLSANKPYCDGSHINTKLDES